MKVVTIDPKFYEAQNYLGLLYSNEDIAVFFGNAINLRPHDIEPRYNLGMYYQETGKRLGSESIFCNFKRIDSLALDPLFNIGYIYQILDNKQCNKIFRSCHYYPMRQEYFTDWVYINYLNGKCNKILR